MNSEKLIRRDKLKQGNQQNNTCWVEWLIWVYDPKKQQHWDYCKSTTNDGIFMYVMQVRERGEHVKQVSE